MRDARIHPDWVYDPPDDLETIAILLEQNEHRITEESLLGDTLRRLLSRAKELYQSAVNVIKDQNPLAYWQPSYEQAILLNAWIWGVNFPLCFAANRIGKTTAFIVNALLWMFPNNPQWRMFKSYTDEWGRTFQVYPRPDLAKILDIQYFLRNVTLPQEIDYYKQVDEDCNVAIFNLLQKELPESYAPVWPAPPMRKSGQIWVGAPDAPFHKQNLMPKWRKLLPHDAVIQDNQTELFMVISTESTTNPHGTTHSVFFKSYEAEDTKWSGDAVQGIILTEGFTQIILNEIKNRLTNESFASWDYTPAEARNTGRRAALAYDIYRKKEQLPLVQFSFIKFSLENSPDRIIGKEKKADMIRIWKGTQEGIARIEGGFFSSSGLVLEHLDKDFHYLDWTLEEVMERYPNGRFYRGIDPGRDHPAACVWGYLTQNNIWFIFRCYSKRGTTISERCQDIIRLSNNAREQIVIGNQIFYREIHPFPNSEPYVLSAIDYHTFKADEVTGQSYATNYTNEGIIVTESTHMKPEDRAVKANSLLGKNGYPYLPHPKTGKAPGAKVFFLTSGEGVLQMLDKFDNLFWDRLKSGENVGQPKDKVPIHGDDELDAFCYLVCGPYVWTPYEPKRIQPRESEPEFGVGRGRSSINQEQLIATLQYQKQLEETTKRQRELAWKLGQPSTAHF